MTRTAILILFAATSTAIASANAQERVSFHISPYRAYGQERVVYGGQRVERTPWRRVNASNEFGRADGMHVLPSTFLDIRLLRPDSVHGVVQSTIEYDPIRSGGSSRVRGITTSRRLQDTVLDSRTVMHVRDSVRITVTAVDTIVDRDGGNRRIEVRELAGHVLVHRWFDSAKQVTLRMYDTTWLSGTEVRTLDNGQRLASPLQFDRWRAVEYVDRAAMGDPQRSRLMSSTAYRLSASIPRVSSPRVRDSLVQRHAVVATQAERDSIESTIGFLDFPEIRERLARNYLAQSDTANALRLVGVPYIRHSAWSYTLLRTALDDPGIAMRFGLSTDHFYGELQRRMVSHPPVAETDTNRWVLAPEAFDLLTREWQEANEPRLRRLGLVARMVLDPYVWADSVIEYDQRGMRGLDDAVGLAYVESLTGEVIPSLSADWRVWKRWMGSRYGLSTGRGRLIRFSEKRFGRAYLDTIAARRDNATNDSARLVYHTIAASVGLPAVAHHELMRMFTSGLHDEQVFVMNEVRRLSYMRADSATRDALERTMLQHLVEGIRLWSRPDTLRVPGNDPGPVRDVAATVVVADSTSDWFRNALRSNGLQVVTEEYVVPDSVKESKLTVYAIEQSGDFARVRIASSYGEPIKSGPLGIAGVTVYTYYVVRVDGRWWLVAKLLSFT